ncbi:MAG TPA: hypothetical protein VGQ83_18565, partial [Polyangia bacterium]
MRVLLLAPLLLAAGCGRGEPRAGTAPAVPEAPSISLTDVRVLGPNGEERLEPSFGRGERLAVAFTARPAVAPLAAVVRVLRPGGAPLTELPPARVTRGPGRNGPLLVPLALPVDAPGGAYRVEVVVTDARG